MGPLDFFQGTCPRKGTTTSSPLKGKINIHFCGGNMEISAFPVGLDAPDSLGLDAINNENSALERTIRGYSLAYRITNMGNVSASRIYRISRWNGNQPEDFSYEGVRFGIDSNVAWTLLIIDPGKGLEAPVIQFIDGEEKKGFVLYARLLHADVLPGVAPDDLLQIRPFCKILTITVEDKSVGKDQGTEPALLLPAHLASQETNEESRMQIFITGKILSVDYDDAFGPEGTLSLSVETPMGPLPMELDLAVLGESQKPLLKKGNLIRATGWLFGDVAIGPYASGIILDLEHNLRVIGCGAGNHDFSRTREIFSDNCQYFIDDELRAVGPEAIIGTLQDLPRLAEERKDKTAFVYGQIMLKKPSETFQNDEKCLAFLDAEGQIDFLMCARTEKSGRIAKLSAVYHSDEIEGLKTTADFQEWCEGISDVPAQDEENEAKENQEDYYENSELAEQLHGDGRAFFGAPFYGFGDMLDILMPGEDDENMEKVTQWIGKAQNVGHYQLGSFTGVYLDYPESSTELGLQFALGKEPEQNSFQVDYFYPYMQGYAQSLKIVATFDWPEKVCGYLAAVWRDKTTINCFVPSYRLWNEKIIFDNHFHLALSGMALHIEPAPHPHFTVEKGQFYEMNLAQFLYKNPDKTAADFEAPVVHTEESVLFVPMDTTCLYEVQSPVKKVENIKFDQHSFTRLLMPIARDWDEDEELLAWIYVSDKKLGELRPKPGDPVLCVIWLCACMTDV